LVLAGVVVARLVVAGVVWCGVRVLVVVEACLAPDFPARPCAPLRARHPFTPKRVCCVRIVCVCAYVLCVCVRALCMCVCVRVPRGPCPPCMPAVLGGCGCSEGRCREGRLPVEDH
jgi:hypothetical protein